MSKAAKKSLAHKQREQSERFMEATEKAAADKSGREFEHMFKKIVDSGKPRPTQKEQEGRK